MKNFGLQSAPYCAHTLRGRLFGLFFPFVALMTSWALLASIAFDNLSLQTGMMTVSPPLWPHGLAAGGAQSGTAWISLCLVSDRTPLGMTLLSALGMSTVMTVAMMLPCAFPAWLQLLNGQNSLQSYGFMAGYISIWLFGLMFLEVVHVGFAAQIDKANMPDGVASAALLFLAGLYQFTPAKFRASQHMCSTPGVEKDCGPARQGMLYAAHCIRANLPLMATMSAFGMMNVVAMSLLTVIMLAEKTSPGRMAPGLVGLGLIGIGGLFFFTQF